MKEVAEKKYSYKSVFSEPGVFLRLIGVLIVATVLTLLLFGFAFLFILQGVVFVCFYLSPYSETAYRLIRFLSRTQNTGKHFSPLPLPLWRIPILGIHVLVQLSLVGVGVWFLITKGFRGQNFLCMLIP